MIKPSEELLSEVLPYNIKRVYDFGSNPNFDDNQLLYSIVGIGDLYNINIYELMHLMKEWAINKGYSLMTEYLPDRKKYFHVCKFYYITDGNKISFSSHFFAEDTEFEAVTKACDFIRIIN